MDITSINNVLLDDGPMVVQRGDNWCCLLCKRQFKSEQLLVKHVDKSSLHRDNLAQASKAGRVRDPSKKRALPLGSDATAAKRERLVDPALERLKQMEEIERALAAKAAASAGIATAGSSRDSGKSVYRDRAAERRQLFGADSAVPSLYGGVKSARDINGNLDWR